MSRERIQLEIEIRLIQQSNQSRNFLITDRAEHKQLFNYSSVIALNPHLTIYADLEWELDFLNYLKLFHSFSIGINSGSFITIFDL
ncbi:unnamed protein product [Paramecium octaurelia]|uniref:Uncharacterized protein n=1 Tax=Paramecium octaurelia TaxID=43137 RepID=A0A8S1X4P3_PAROT|nr:unnamed protein product [Paramecium octaurelia]CAD8196051.1 unnamed protein product [Paramecium octaurelia]